MDRSAEFRRLAGLGATRSADDALAPLGGAFVRALESLSARLADIRRAAKRDPDQGAAIKDCQEAMGDLERLSADSSDLGERAPRPGFDRDLFAHRRGAISALYEDLRELAASAQASQADELQREADVAGFFAPSAIPAAARRAAPPPPAPAHGADALSCGGLAATTAELQAEEQQLLTAFESDLDKIHETQAKIEEVANLVGLFANKVHEQEEQVEQISADIQESTDHVENATKHLNRAVSNQSSYRFYVVCWFIGSACFLLVLDFIDARWSPI
eukprot:TRINITY_DN6526_c0_g3_i1.p1 TRINITY_DN6526_c0_g3~~TRINITY_DN6526_c0_g3_i1.p1  ORF type:complete len:305 (-),score=71.65 TRINITY_DN6526_c0_g3_i1:203-1027(-)